MTKREEVRFAVDGDIELGAWLYLPQKSSAPAPAITMAHGYAGVRQHGIARFADAFAAAGFVVLPHDHRSFGVSGGEPRQDIDPWRQIADWRRAVSYLESRPEVDASRIGIWGSSYAGGHHLGTVSAIISEGRAASSRKGGRLRPDAANKRPSAWSDFESGLSGAVLIPLP